MPLKKSRRHRPCSTVLGGEGNDEGAGIAVDPGGDVYIVGYPSSTVLPLRSAFQVEIRGPDDVFLARLNHDASPIRFSSYLGGGRPPTSTSQTEGGEDPAGIALGPGGKVWATGLTTSFDFPITADAFQPKSVGVSCTLWGEPCGDLFVTEITTDGPGIVPATHLDVSPTELPAGGSVMAHFYEEFRPGIPEGVSGGARKG